VKYQEKKRAVKALRTEVGNLKENLQILEDFIAESDELKKRELKLSSKLKLKVASYLSLTQTSRN